jgi:two-component system sensor histidine kinase RegB
MGLGLFIAKTLLERTGAEVEFANGDDPDMPPGAVVRVSWPIEEMAPPEAGGLGENVANRL